MKSILRLLTLFIFIITTFQVSASHIMGGNITYEYLSNSNAYAFTAEFYQDCNGVPLPNSIPLTISSSCGIYTVTLELMPSGAEIVTPTCASAPDACIGGSGGAFGVQKYVYTHVPASQGVGISDSPITLPACNDWVISWSSCCRNSIISTGSANEGFHIYTSLDNSNNLNNNSPTFNFNPIFFGCVGDTVNYSHGVSDVENDSLVFSLTDCQELSGGLPSSVNYTSPYSGTNPLSTSYIVIDSSTGNLTFMPTLVQVGIICMLVEEYRNGAKIGEVIRDIQINILNCTNESPSISGINGVSGQTHLMACKGQNTCFTVDAVDNNTAQNVALYYSNTLPGATHTIVSNGNQAQITICWTPTSNDIGINHFSLSTADDACPINGTANLTYTVEVLGGQTGDLNFSDSIILAGNTIDLPIQGSASSCTILWNNDPTLSCTNCFNPTASPISTTTYYYQINCSTGNCSSLTDSVTIYVYNYKNINGIVNQSNGQPLANSAIYLYKNDGSFVDSTLTNNQGSYQFTNILDTTAYIKAVPNTTLYNSQYATYYNNSTILSGATLIPLTTNTIVNFQTRPILSKTLRGNITASDGALMSSSQVILYNTQHQPLDTTQTDANGYYEFNMVLDTIVLLSVNPNATFTNQATTFYDSALTVLQATPITIITDTLDVDFATVQNQYYITGYTYANGSNSIFGIIPNIKVVIYDEFYNPIDSVLSDSLGYFSLISTHRKIHIGAIADASSPYQTTYYMDLTSLSPLSLLTLSTPFYNYNFTLTLYTKGQIVQGQVLRSDGQPLDSSFVLIDYVLQNGPGFFTLTDSQGYYKVFTASPDSFIIRAIPSIHHNDQFTTYYDSMLVYTNATTAYLSGIDTVPTTLNFNTLSKQFLVSGTINRSDGQPLSNSKVRIYNGSQQLVDSLFTDGSGFYTYTHLLDTIYLEAIVPKKIDKYSNVYIFSL